MIANLIGSQWSSPDVDASLPIYNPATGEVIGQVPLSGAKEVDAAVQAAVAAYKSWSRTALMERVRLMFRYKALLEEHFEDLAAIITRHHGKTLEESRGEVSGRAGLRQRLPRLTTVTGDDAYFSVLGGRIEVRGVRVSGDDPPGVEAGEWLPRHRGAGPTPHCAP